MKKKILLILVFSLVSVSLATEDTWTTKANMPTARYVLSSSVVDGKIYAIGGTPGSGAFSTVEEYDVMTNTWTRKASMPMIRAAGTSSTVNGKIYVIGGRQSLNGANISSVQQYDPKTDTWTAKANMLTARSWLSSSVVNGKIYAIGGSLTYNSTAVSTVEEYDPATNTWTRKANMPTARVCLSASAVNGKIYAIGGNLSNQWYHGSSIVEEYDPATDTWTRKADMPTGRTYISTCAVNGKIYTIGGLTTSGNHLSPVEEYNPVTDTWRRVADMPTARSGVATSAVNGKIYAIGGWVGTSTILSTVEEYTPNTLVVDFNADGIVDGRDVSMMIEFWQTDEPFYDIAPPPFGDGIVDVQDLILLSEHLFEEFFPSELLAYWKLDETEIDIVYNSISDNHGITIGDPTWLPDGGHVAGSLEFDGIDDYVETDFVLDPAEGSFSVFAWIKGGESGQVVLSQTGGANWLSADPSEGNLMTELVPPTTRSPLPPLVSDTRITDNNWHHIGFSWNDACRALYVDGVLVAEDIQSNLAGSSNGLYIGAGNNLDTGTFFSGLIDDVRIYNVALFPAQVATLAQ
jgi:N-acetylneuraminic acid mutarotase